MRLLSQLDNSQSKNSLDDPKVETIAELFRRRIGGGLGIVSTAYIADATPGSYNLYFMNYLPHTVILDSRSLRPYS